jgi:hypothetical protein
LGINEPTTKTTKKNNERNPENKLKSKQNKAQMKTCKDRKLQVIHETIQNGSKQELGPLYSHGL